MSNSIEVSVVMAVSKEDLRIFKRSVDSILNQTYSNYEFIVVVVDPGIFDVNWLLERYEEKNDNIVVLKNDRNRGLPYSLNRGIKQAKGIYIARHDADDISLPERLKLQHDFMIKHPEIDVLGSGLNYVTNEGSILMTRTYDNNIAKNIKRFSPIAHPTMFAKKDLFEKYGYYDVQKPFVEDYDLWIRWFVEGVRFYNLNVTLYNYCQNKDSIKSSRTKSQLFSTAMLQIKYAKVLKFNIIDYCSILFHFILLIMPQRLIFYLFYNKYGSKS